MVDHSAIFDRLIDEVPQMVEKMKQSKKDTAAAEEFSQQLEKVIQETVAQEAD